MMTSILLMAILAAGSMMPVSVASPPGDGAREYFTDIPLIDQNGHRWRLYSDLMEDRIVIVSAFFTTCDGVCPVTTAALVKIQDWLGDRLGKDVNILSLTVDPATDTPSRMKAYAEGFHTKPGWYFLTGKRDDLHSALRKFGQAVQFKENHSPIVMIGNLKTGLWKKAMGLANIDALLPVVQSVVEDGE